MIWSDPFICLWGVLLRVVVWAFLKVSKLRERKPLQLGRLFSHLEGISFGFHLCHSFAASSPFEIQHPSFDGVHQWKQAGPAASKAAFFMAGFLGNLCHQVQQLKFLIHKEAHLHPAHEIGVKRNWKIRKGILTCTFADVALEKFSRGLTVHSSGTVPGLQRDV